jgi:RNase adapter protein RapZ
MAAKAKLKPRRRATDLPRDARKELVVSTGMSGSGKASVLKAFEDMGYYCVDNMPIELFPRFVDMTLHSSEIERTALVVDIREGHGLERLPKILDDVRTKLKVRIVFLETSDEALVRRFSETRRPHPLGTKQTVKAAIQLERKILAPIRSKADIVVDTSKFTVHELRAHIIERFQASTPGKSIFISAVSFGYRKGVPDDADLVFDVRFLPNPHFIPELRPFNGTHPKVATYVLSFPQTREFIKRIAELLVYLLPHYIREGKSYLTVAFGCTGGQHRSVLIAEEMRKALADSGYQVKVQHRDAKT